MTRRDSVESKDGGVVDRQIGRLRYVAIRVFRRAVLRTFYPAVANDASLLGLRGGLLLLNGLSQRVFRLNGKARFPVHFTSRITNPDKLVVADGVARYLAISGGCYVQTANGVSIGSNTMIAPGVKLISANHDTVERSQHVGGQPITIGEGCWLGANVVVLPGVSIGDRTIVGAGAVVTKDLPADCVAVGNPAKPQRQL